MNIDGELPEPDGYGRQSFIETERRYRLIQDEDGHWYVIRVDETEKFEAWVAAGPYWDGYVGKDFGDLMVNGPHTVSFPTWSEE